MNIVEPILYQCKLNPLTLAILQIIEHLLRRPGHSFNMLPAPVRFGFRHNKARPLAGLAQDAPDIFADDAEHQELRCAEDGNGRHERGPARHRALHEEEAHDRIDHEAGADRREGEREPDRKPQRTHAVRRNPGHRELDHATGRVFRAAALAHALAERYAAERIAEPAHDAAQKQVLVVDPIDGVDHHAVEQHEVAAAGPDMNITNRVQNAIEEARADALVPRYGLFVTNAFRCDDLEARTPLLHQIRNEPGRLFQVSVDHDHRTAAGMSQTRTQGGLVPEIAREGNITHRRIGGSRMTQDVQSAVIRAVVDVENLKAPERRHYLTQRRKHRRYIGSLVIGRQHDREIGW